jgi:hypothetical protein
METISLIHDKRILYVTKDVFQDLSETRPSESGYIVLYRPEETRDYYTLGLARVGVRDHLKPVSIDAKAIEYLVNNPDTTIAHYMNISKLSDMADNFGIVAGLYAASQGSLDIFAEVKDKNPDFFQLVRCYGYHAFPMPFKRIDNNTLLRFEQRVRELNYELAGLNSPGKV